MQLMTWPLSRFGSRFGLLFEPYQRRIMHSAVGRFMDQPLDLAVGIMHEDGSQRVLPFTRQGDLLYGCEQFERNNSITFRGFDEVNALRFEFNIHSPFYPQNEKLCLLPAFFMELRVMPAENIRWRIRENMQAYNPPEEVEVFIRLSRTETRMTAGANAIDLYYEEILQPSYDIPRVEISDREISPDGMPDVAKVNERILSMNDGSEVLDDDFEGVGLKMKLPVTKEGSGVKWRLVWGTHTQDNIADVMGEKAKFKYADIWNDIDAVMDYAVEHRDDMLIHSRRFEKLIGQATIIQPKRHLLTQAMQSFFSNLFWLKRENSGDWLINWEGTCFFNSTVDVEYNVAMFYLAVWPELLKTTLHQWTLSGVDHKGSAGLVLAHDMGCGLKVTEKQAYPHPMPVEENANFLLLLQAYCHWTGDLELAQNHATFIERLAWYLIWTDRDDSGFPSEGTANTVDDANPAIQYARKQTYLAIKRVAALQAAADLLQRVGLSESAGNCRQVARRAIPQIESTAWLNDHYVVCIDKDTTGLVDVDTGKPLPIGELTGWDDYTIYSSNGLLLPAMVGQTAGFDRKRIVDDILNSARETLTPYGCSHCSSNKMNVWISQNIWRDLVGRYFRLGGPEYDPRYWDMQVAANTGSNSFGYIDTYIGNELAFYPRGAVTFGYLLAGPRLMIDHLATQPHISVDPDRHKPQRWPLLPLADWKAGRVPVCVVDSKGRVVIEGPITKVTIKDQIEDSYSEAVIG